MVSSPLFGVLNFGFEYGLKVLRAKVQTTQARDAEGIYDLVVYGLGGRVVYVGLIRGFCHFKLSDVISNLICAQFPIEGFEFQQSKQCQRNIADGEMTINCFGFLDINRPAFQIRFKNPERFFNSPKVVVDIVDFFRTLFSFGGYKKIVACIFQIFIVLIFIQFRFYPYKFSILVQGAVPDVFRGISKLIPCGCLDGWELACDLVELPPYLLFLFFRKSGVVCYNPLFPDFELYFIPIIRIMVESVPVITDILLVFVLEVVFAVPDLVPRRVFLFDNPSLFLF